jgi:hypothetical protein
MTGHDSTGTIKSANTHAVTKVYTYDITRQYKLMLAFCMHNLKLHYEHIIHSFLSITLQSMGVTKLVVVCAFKTLQNLENYIQTSYGNSTTTYSGTLRVFPLNGEVHGDTSKGLLVSSRIGWFESSKNRSFFAFF